MEAMRAGVVLIRVAQVLRQIDPEFPMQRAEALFHLAAAREPVTISALAEALGVSLSSASRNVAELSKVGTLKVINGVPGRTSGLGLVEAFEDPMDRRTKRVRMTKRGETLMASIATELEKLNGPTKARGVAS